MKQDEIGCLMFVVPLGILLVVGNGFAFWHWPVAVAVFWGTAIWVSIAIALLMGTDDECSKKR